MNLFRIAVFRQIDWFLLGVPLLLTGAGFAAQYSIGLSLQQSFSNSFLHTQLIAFGVGLALCLLLFVTHRHTLFSSSRLVYIFSLLLLIAVLFFGVDIRGTRGWFRAGGFSFQPAEFAKVSLVLALSWLVERFGRQFHRFAFLFLSGLLTALPIGLIFLQPDLGSAVVLFFIWFGFLLTAHIPFKYIFGIVVGMVAIVLFSWFFVFANYQKDRVLTFVDSSRDPLGAGYNVSQSIIAIGSGGLLGRGLGFGSQSQLRFLPEAQTDFVFAVIAEELGFVGALGMLVLFGLFFWRLLFHMRHIRSEFGAYCVAGILFVFFTQLVFNIGGATGLLPITGVTLPFVSYGGSSLIINYVLLGIALCITRGEYV